MAVNSEGQILVSGTFGNLGEADYTNYLRLYSPDGDVQFTQEHPVFFAVEGMAQDFLIKGGDEFRRITPAGQEVWQTDVDASVRGFAPGTDYFVAGGYVFESILEGDQWLAVYGLDGSSEWIDVQESAGESTWSCERPVVTVDDDFVVQCEGDLLKMNRSGTEIWTVDLSPWGTSVLLSAEPEGGVLFLAGGFNLDPHLVKLDENGEVVWESVYEDPSEDFPTLSGLAVDSTGAFVRIGSSNSTAAVAKWDSEGELLWSRILKDTGQVYDVSIDENDHVIVAGWILIELNPQMGENNDVDAWVAKLAP